MADDATRLLDKDAQHVELRRGEMNFDEHLFHEHRIHGHHRNVFGNVGVNLALSETPSDPLERRFDDLLDGFRTLVELDGSGLQPNHLEEVRYEVVQPTRLLDYRTRELLA